MHYGQPYGAYGDVSKHIKTLEAESTITGGRVRIEAAEGLGDAYYQIYVNNVFAASVWCVEGVISDWINVQLPSTGTSSLVAFRIGAQPDFNNSFFASIDEEAPQNVTASWTWDYEVLGTPTNEYLTGWTISGLKRAQSSQGDKNTRGTLPAEIYVSAGVATVSVGTLASGTGAVGTTLTLTELNDSGVTGTVDVDALAVTGSGTLSIRWPRSMRILRDTTNPPSTVIKTIKNTGGDTSSVVDSTVLSAGIYYYAFQAISDTDDIGDQAIATAITVTGAPVPPSSLSYVSGDASATVVSWTPSTTAGATYNIYIANPDDGFLDTTTPAATAVAGSTGATLPAITGYPGVAQVLVRAELSGVEELNGNILFLEYDSLGAYINPRPNIPSIGSISVSSGLTINVVGNYAPANEQGVATSIQLFTRTPDAEYDFETPDDTSTLGSEVNGFKRSTTNKTFLVVGWYYVTLKAITATDTQCIGNASELLVYVSDVNAEAPEGTFTLSRG